MSLEENEDHEEEDAAPKLSVSGIFKGQVLNGICNAQYGDDNLNLRYSYKVFILFFHLFLTLMIHKIKLIIL